MSSATELKSGFPPLSGRSLFVLALVVLSAAAGVARADSVVVFNEIMYHPPPGQDQLEWVELRNQMAVDVDLSRWSIQGGIDYQFPEGTAIPGRGYGVVALAPADLASTRGLTNVLGPFAGRLSNGGDTLRLLNNNGRLMDSLSYGVEGDWPVGPDGSGVSLAKRDEEAASPPATNWAASAMIGGTPGGRNFSPSSFEVSASTPVRVPSAWRYDPAAGEPDPAWRQREFDDGAWPSGAGLFQWGNVPPPLGQTGAVLTAFSTGVGEDGAALPPGSADPHYQLTLSVQSVPPPPAIAATVIQNHPAWLANDTGSSWVGAVNPGTADVAAGSYNFRTTFTLEGYDPASAVVRLTLAADNQLTNVFLNGTALGLSFAGFSAWSPEFAVTKGLQAGVNVLDFHTLNDGGGPNPAGFRARLAVAARRNFPVQTALPSGRTTYRFRTSFVLPGQPRHTALQLSTVLADGAVFHLNGAEVLRLGLPQGPVNDSTLALSNAIRPSLAGPFVVSGSSLVPGTNVLAVEVHQGPEAGHGVLFGAELSLTTTNILVPPPVPLAFNEIASATNAGFWLELMNWGATDLDLDGCVLACASAATNREYVFPPQMLGAGGFAQVTEATLGFRPASGDRLFLYGPDRLSVLDAVVAKRRALARWPYGAGAYGHPFAPTPAAANDFRFHDEVVIDEIMYHAPAVAPQPASFGTNYLVRIADAWKYHALGQDLGAAWRAPDYDDAFWPSGQSVFYNTASYLPAPKNTLLSLTNAAGGRIVTWYFRTPFVYYGPPGAAVVTLRPLVDDGAVYYVNGAEFYRQNMPLGEIHATDLASGGVGTPAFSGPFAVTVTNLVTGTNLLAVEVHQFTLNPIAADMAFGLEAFLVGQLSPSTPRYTPPESWVELFNRSGQKVDLSGWRLGADLDYAFPPGTALPPGGYLVVAEDPGYMRSNYPGLAAAGPFSGALRNSGGHVRLLDPVGNPADEVRYLGSKPWPDYANGGGASLELRDPQADNARPEAWAASDESGRSAWQQYTYRAVAANRLGPTLWKEFVLGLLDAGECLIDDVSVVESPAGTPVSLLQNGDFESGLAGWRALGDHNRSRVEADPDNAANHVLHLVATAPTEHIHNHLETTLAGGRSVVDGREYQVSFRAKWLAGNNRLNTRLYFNRVARTTELAMPSQHGTPGAPNSTRVANLGPTFAHLGHAPIVPKPSESVIVSVDAGDPQGVQAAILRWSANGASWTSTPMLPAGPAAEPGYTNYAAVLPAQPAGTLVRFYVQAADALGALATFPAAGAGSHVFYKVDENKALMTRLHRFRLLMTPEDAAFLHAHTNVMSMDLLGLTVVVDEQQTFYDVGVHLQSSERGRDDPSRVGFTIRFNADRLYRGNQNTISLDRSGGYSGRGGRHDELLLWHAVNHAGGIPGIDCDLAQVFAPRSQEDSTGLLRMSAFNGDYFDHQFSQGRDGNLYKLELVYYPLTSVNGDPQAPKLPQPDDVIDLEIQDRGDDKEDYRWLFRQENHAGEDDYTQVIALNKVFSLSGSALETRANVLVDMDEFLRTLAFKAFTGDVDTYTYGYTHNFKFYFRPEDGRALGLLWDMDFSYVQGTSSGFPGGSSANTYRLVTLPNNYRRYCNHLLDLLTTTVNAGYLRPWADHYGGLAGQDWSGAVDYLQQRADYLRSVLPLTTPFAITSNSGRNFGATNDHAALTGTAPMMVKEIRVNGVAYPLAWTSLTAWTLAVPLPARVNALVVQGIGNDGKPLGGALATITVTNLGTPALQPVLINEWMADNGGPGGLPNPSSGQFSDWLELYNPNRSPVDLSGSHLTDSLAEPLKWEVPAPTTIPGQGFLLIWADKQTNLNTAGSLHAGFQLNKGGDTIGLFSPDGTLQHSVSFGPQSRNVSQGLFPDGDTNAFHFMTNWTPRAANKLGAPPPPEVGLVTVLADGSASFELSAPPDRACRIDYADTLESGIWIPLGTNRLGMTPGLFSDRLPGAAQRFYRVVLLP